MDATFKTRLASRERLIGTMLTLPSPEVAEIFASSGFDFLWLDMEHGLLDVQEALRLGAIPAALVALTLARTAE
jgi:2-dehydro-3-deoxyglucarate aldolase/4-hydroxy-2-oxoheptanedioate aldolase